MTQSTSSRFTVLATACLLLAGLVSSNPVKTVTIKPGQKIQAAIDAAKPGTTIIVTAGTYNEQLTIKTDRISVVGQKGTILAPPEPPIPEAEQNECYGVAGPGTNTGICVWGYNVTLGPYPGQEHSKVLDVTRRVKGVSITGFQIQNFIGENIALYGAEDATVKNNKLIDGLVYGYLAAGSKNTDFRGNKVKSTGLAQFGPDQFGLRFIAACSDNPKGATVWDNEIDGYGIALCVQTNKANIQHNHITNACYGIFVDPGIDGAIVRHNTVGPTNPNCATLFGVTGGIVLSGAQNTEVQHNTITGQNLGAATTADNFGAGIALFDVLPPSPLAGLGSSNNKINRNDVTGNQVDIDVRTTGTGNVFKKNDCQTPASLCT